jgi:hypothetical protein
MRPYVILVFAVFVIAIFFLHACASDRATKLLSNSIDAEQKQAAKPNPYFND